MEEFTMTIIGSGSALPMHGRHPSAQVIQYGDFCCLIDCGEGTQERLKQAGVKAFKINTILISHLHGDHIFGLPGLLSSYAHLKRTAPLTVYGPAGLNGFLDAIITYSELKIPFPLAVKEISPNQLIQIFMHKDLEVLTFPLYHRIACNGYLFREVNTKVKLRKDMLKEYQLTPAQFQMLSQGKAIELNGELLPADVFIRESTKLISYAYCSDTRYDIRLLSAIKGVTILYHETTFMNEMSEMAEQTGHSTSGEAGLMASAAQASCLITGHYSSRYKEVKGLLEEAEACFKPVLEAVEGKKYNLKSLANGLNIGE
jgi:ribonuclease Z